MTKKNDRQSGYILMAMFMGLALGLTLFYTGQSSLYVYIQPIGVIFLKLLKMVITPLVFSSIYLAILNLGSPENLGKLGVRSITYYFITTSVAVFIGIVMVNLLQPGVGLELKAQELTGVVAQRVHGQDGLFPTILKVILDAVPSNPFAALAQGDILQVIVIAVFFALMALKAKEKTQGFTSAIVGLENIAMSLTQLLMKFAPLGVFVLMVEAIAQTGPDAIVALGKYMFVVVIGLFIHSSLLLAYGSWKSKLSPWYILKGLGAPLLTAFSTSSSAATLPLTIKAVEENLKVRPQTANFVLPLGATINMDGTALYEAVAVIFIGQVYGLDLSIGTQLIIFITSAIAAVGAAAIPGAGLVTMGIVLTAAGFPLEGVGLILSVDRILDMFRTTVNVFGDCIGAIVVDKSILDDKKTS